MAFAVCIPGLSWGLVEGPQDSSVLPDYEVVRPVSGGYPSAAQQRHVRVLQELAPTLRVDFGAEGQPRLLHAWGAPLSAPCGGDASAAARSFVVAHRELFRLSIEEVEALEVSRRLAVGATRVIWLSQTREGLRVEGADLRLAIDPDGRVLWLSAGRLVPGLAQVSTTARISPESAIRSAAANIGMELAALPLLKGGYGSAHLVYESGPFLSEIRVEPLVYPLSAEAATLAFRVSLEPRGPDKAWYLITVEAGAGRVLQRVNLYKYATNQGLVFEGAYPDTVAVPPFPSGGGVPATRASFGYRWASTTGYTIPAPFGAYRYTIGNNVDSKEDWLRDDEATQGARADGGPLQEFFFPFLNAYETSTGTTDPARIADAVRDFNAAATNLFYWSNHWHDYMYALGFDEASGNFQHDNFSRGGCGGDPVLADAQDGAQPAGGGAPSLNNANFATPPEPFSCVGNRSPRMNMYLWRWPAPGAGLPITPRDGNFDADIIIHEYSHGTSHRLVGGPALGCVSGPQAGAMGEGWGDWYGSSYFDDPVVAEYSTNNPVVGIRGFAMDANPRTYAELCDPICQVHRDGEIHASTLWDMRARVGRAVAEQLVTDAMKLTPCGPSFLDYRDGLLLADAARYGGRYACDIWSAYLPRGMGYDAKGANSSYRETDFAFDAPQCSGLAHLRYHSHRSQDTDGDGLFGKNEPIELWVKLGNLEGGAAASGITATLTTTTPGVVISVGTASYPMIPKGGASEPAQPFRFTTGPGFVCGAPIDFELQMSWSPGLSRGDSFRERGGSAPGVRLAASDAEGASLPITGPMTISVTENHTPGGSRSYWSSGACYAGDDLTCMGPCNDSCATITLPEVSLPPTQSAWIEFWATYNAEYLWDGIYVELSEDGGLSFVPVTTLNYPAVIPAGAIGCSPVSDRPGVNGPPLNGGRVPWTRYAGDLTAWAGKRVVLRIVYHHDWCIYFEGAYIDDVDLTLRDCTTAPFVSTFISRRQNDDTLAPGCTDADGYPDPGETVEVALEVTNSGNSAANGLQGTLRSPSPFVTVLSGSQSFGNLAPGQSGMARFRYAVAAVGPACFEDVLLELDLTANAGSYAESLPLPEALRSDPAGGAWLDDFEGGQAAWTASLGPAGTRSDFALRQIDCVSNGGNRFFWATQRNIVPTVCNTNEPDYSADSDSLLTSPPIDLGAPGMQLLRASWGSYSVPNTIAAGLVEVSIDHDGDGVFTPLASVAGGFGAPDPSDARFHLEIAQNPLGAPILAKDTTQFVRFRFRVRSPGADPGPGSTSEGMLIDAFRLEWQKCDLIACAPGIRRTGASGRQDAAASSFELPAGALAPGPASAP